MCQLWGKVLHDKNTSKALDVIDAANGDDHGAIRALDVTANNHADTVKLLRASSGDVDGAINLFKKAGKDADVAVISVGFDVDGKSNVRFATNGIVASKELDDGAGGSKIGARVGVAMAA